MFNEVTAFDGLGEWMIHLDKASNPIRIYTYKDVPTIQRDYKMFGKSPENECYTIENYQQISTNELFVDYIGDLKYAWSYLRKFVSDEDID